MRRRVRREFPLWAIRSERAARPIRPGSGIKIQCWLRLREERVLPDRNGDLAGALAGLDAAEAELGLGEGEDLLHNRVEAAGGRERSKSIRDLRIPFIGGTEIKSVVSFP